MSASNLHAKTRPPSAAHRWIHCPESAHVTAMYPNDETDASLKGDNWHNCMEDTIRFGFVPPSADPDMTEAFEDLLAYVMRRIAEKGEMPIIKVEVRLDIPLTGEFGTADIVLIWSDEIEVIDHKSGYVPVNVVRNEQMLCYLIGVIALYGRRPKYKITIHQPNFDHVDGPLRSYDVTDLDIVLFENEVTYSIAHENELIAGPWCKETYCPHRGACEAFKVYTKDDLTLGWNTSEYKAMSDADLVKALDAAEELAGYRNALRVEAMRRIMGMDRKLDGYKVVKGRRSRAVLKPKELVVSVANGMGAEWAARLFPDLNWIGGHVKEWIDQYAPTGKLPEELYKNLGTPKHIEDVIKQYAKVNKMPRGGWKDLYDAVVGAYIRETANGLSLEKAIDGRPAHQRGSEFGPLTPAPYQAAQANQNTRIL